VYAVISANRGGATRAESELDFVRTDARPGQQAHLVGRILLHAARLDDTRQEATSRMFAYCERAIRAVQLTTTLIGTVRSAVATFMRNRSV
jgi:hypothetical protein